MRTAAASLMAIAGSATAHPGAEGHFHWVGMEHLLLLIVVCGLLFYAQRDR